MLSQEWQDLILKKRVERDSHIPGDWCLPENVSNKVSSESHLSAFDLLQQTAVLTALEVDITENHDAASLVKLMADGKLSSCEVTLAFCKRAALAHQLINPLTEIFFEKALERARWLDKYLAKEGKPMGPLHGLPISLKVILIPDVTFDEGFGLCIEAPDSQLNE